MADTSNSSPPAGSGSSIERRCVEVAIAVVFNDNGKLLICKRKADTVLGGYWEFPGGKCNAAEPPADCAKREVEEETALHVRVRKALPIIEHEYPHARVRLHPFICRHDSGTLELREVAEARWISPAELSDYRFPEANGTLLRAIISGEAAPV
jgi:mutator protein MutT